jgi:hypothetical protein
MKYVALLSLLFVLFNCKNNKSSPNQITSPYKDTLIDNLTGSRYYLDTAQIYIYAFDQFGKLQWKTDPWKDNSLMEYRVKRPKILYFRFRKDEWTDSVEVIAILYNNSQFGYLDKLTGKFKFQGQD